MTAPKAQQPSAWIDRVMELAGDAMDSCHGIGWDSQCHESWRDAELARIRAVLEAHRSQPSEWRDMSSAPMDGTEVLAWREDCGTFIASYTSPDSFPLAQEEIDEMDEVSLFSKDWFTQWPQALRLDGRETPTRWQPLPTPPSNITGEQSMNALQKATVLTLQRMIKQVEADEDEAGAYACCLDNMLDELASSDFFGTEGSTDPRGDFRNGTWSCEEGRVEQS